MVAGRFSHAVYTHRLFISNLFRTQRYGFRVSVHEVPIINCRQGKESGPPINFMTSIMTFCFLLIS